MVAVLLEGLKRNSLIVASLLASVGLVAATVSPAFAATPTNASLNLNDSRPSGSGGSPSVTSDYTFTATGLTTGTSVGCFELDFGTSADGTGTVTDLDGTSGSVTSNGFVSGATTFSWVNGSSEQIIRATTATPAQPVDANEHSIVWAGVQNGSTDDTGYFAVFTTYEEQACTTVVDTTTVQFIYTAGQAVTLTVDPNFTFTVAGLATPDSVNGTALTVDSSGTPDEIPFGTVTTSANSVVGQRLTINTNAQNGYDIFVRYTGALSGAGTIDDFSGPASFSGAGTENFGFTTEDTDVLAAGNWDGLSTTQQAIANETSALTAADVTDTAYQVGVGTNTPAGAYTTTIILTAVPKY